MSALEEFASWKEKNREFANRLQEERAALLAKLLEVDAALAMLGARPKPQLVKRGRPKGSLNVPVGPMTAAQAKVLRAIRDGLAERGYPPTHRDLMKLFGWGSTTAVSTHLRALERKGMLTIATGASRGVAITEAGLACITTKMPAAQSESPAGGSDG